MRKQIKTRAEIIAMLKYLDEQINLPEEEREWSEYSYDVMLGWIKALNWVINPV